MSGIGPRPFSKNPEVGTRLRDKAIVTITVHRASSMTPEGRKEIAAWLRRQAIFLEVDGDKCAKRFIARYCAR